MERPEVDRGWHGSHGLIGRKKAQNQKGICASSGSACLADSDEPSHVIKAMKPESAASRQMIRFSLDAANTVAEVKKVLSGVHHAVKMLRA